MTPVYQTQFGKTGNCWAACVATITGVPLAQVPNFCHEYGEDKWWDPYVSWLNARGFAPLAHTYDSAGVALADLEEIAWGRECGPLVPWIAGGLTPSGSMHAVVFLGGALFHDPTPPPFRDQGTPLARVTDVNFLFPMLRSFP